MPFPSSPIEIQIDPPDSGACYPATTTGDTLRFPNSSIIRAPQTQDWTHNPNAKLGPYAWDGRLFGVFVDTLANTVEVWSSADGETWEEDDAANHPSIKANTGYDESTEPLEYGLETCAACTNIARDGATVPDGDVPTVFVMYFDGSRQVSVAEFDLSTRAWIQSASSGYDAIASTEDFEVSPICSCEYVPANDEVLVFWNRSGPDPDSTVTINRATYSRASGGSVSTASTVNASSSLTRQLHTTCADPENSLVYVFYRGDTGAGIRGVVFNSSYGQTATFALGSGSTINRGGPAFVDSTGKVWVSWVEETSGGSFTYEVLVSSATSSDTPTWAASPTSISDENRSSYPMSLVETADDELYLLSISHTTIGQTTAELVVTSHAYNRGTGSWGARTELVGNSGGNQGDPCYEFRHQSLSARAYTNGSGENTFGVFFDRGTGSSDTSEPDPRGSRFDAVMPVWFYGDAPGLPSLNYYGPAGPMEPGVTGGGPYSL